MQILNFIKNRKKILGMNSRNLSYIRPHNLKRAIRVADDKLVSKRVLKKNDLPVPALIEKITSYQELENFDWTKLPNSFALKPNCGLGGEGILVVYGKKKNGNEAWIKADGSTVSLDDLKNHISNILDGNFSLSGVPDKTFFEERVRLLKLFKPYTFKGIPDVRIIVYNSVPVMAMLRLPTKESGGKANLQQGAVGVGIDIASGVTTSAVQGKKSHLIEYAPGTRLPLSGIKIPHWQEILEMAIKAQRVSGLGFLGADIAIDQEKGPVFLELNARPGLSIQIANLSGLQERLQRVAGLKIKTIKRGVNVGMDLFGGEVEEEIEEISGKRIIGSVEKVKLTGKNETEIEVEAKIDTGATSTSIDIELAKQLGFEDVLNYFQTLNLPHGFSREEAKKIEEDLRKKYLQEHSDLEDIDIIYSSSGNTIRPKIKINFIMDNQLVSSKVNIIDRAHLKYPIIIGKGNLGRFLIDVSK